MPSVNPTGEPDYLKIPNPDAFSSPYDDPPVEAHKSIGGFIGNFKDDVKNFIEGIPAAIKVVWTAGSQLVGDSRWPHDLYQHPEYLSEELRNTGTHVIKSFTDTYKDGLGEALYKHPFSVLMDATTVADLVGGGVKAAGKVALSAAERDTLEVAGNLARAAGEASKAADFSRAGDLMRQAGDLRTSVFSSGSPGVSILQLGDQIQRLPGTLLKAPFQAAGDLALKVPQVRTIAESYALTPLGLAEKDALSSQMLRERVLGAQAAQEILDQGLTTAQRDEYWAIRDGYQPLSTASDPVIQNRAELWQKANLEYEKWMMEFNLKNAGQLADGVLKPLAERLYNEELTKAALLGEEAKGALPALFGPDGAMSREWLDRAAAWKSGANPWGVETTPSYHPFFHERTNNPGEFANAMKSEANTIEYVKRFERKTGMGPGLISDPNTVEARAILQIHDLRGVVNYISDSISRLGKVKKGAQASEGYVFMDPMLKRYIEGGLINAQDLMTKNLAEAVRGKVGGSFFDVLQQGYQKTAEQLGGLDAVQQMREFLKDPTAWQIEIPKEVAYLIESQLKGVTGPLRFYDNLLNTWRNVMLRYLPRFYINNLLGHSVLLLTGGVLPFTKSMARDEKLLPAEALSSAGLMVDAGYSSDLLGELPGMRTVNKWTEKAAEITGSVPRQLMVNAKMRGILEAGQAVNDTVTAALHAYGPAEDAVKAAYQASNDLKQLGGRQAIAARLGQPEAEGFLKFLEGEKKPVFTAEQTQRIQDIDGQLIDLQKQMRKEEALSNIEREVGGNVDAKSIVGINTAKIRKQTIFDKMKSLEQERSALGAPLGREDWIPERDFPHLAELQELSAQREYLAPVAAKVEEAVKQMETFLGNYGRLHPLERQVARRIIPFWTFAKTMNALVFKLPFIRPKTAFLWNQYAKFMIDAANDDRLPDRFRNSIPIGGNDDGDIVFMKTDGFSPFRDVTGWNIPVTPEINLPIPKLLDPTQNPFIKLMVETRGGYDTFTERPFTTPEDFVTVNGTVWRFDPDRMELKPVIPQKPLLHSLFDQIPHMKVIQEALDSFAATRGLANNAFPHVATPEDPDGNYIYNRQWWWAASRAFGFPVKVQNPEQVEQQHNLMVQAMMDRFRSRMVHSDPDTQAKLEHILEDIGNGGWRLKEWGD
jgi:hypothetical protein